MAFLQFLQSIDTSLFQFINGTMDNYVLDYFLVWVRNKYLWIPLYVFLIAKTILHYKKHAYIILLTAVLAVSISDHLSSGILKPLTERVRPCNNTSIPKVNIKAPCRNSFSFVSSHASNHFAVAIFFYFILGVKKRRGWHFLFAWAFLICFAQVYVGLHFPGDVLVGALVGVGVSWLFLVLLQRYYLSPYNVSFED